MANTILGKVSIVPKGRYDPLAEYKRLDVVTWAGSSYLALRSVQGVEPADGEDWMLLALAGDELELTYDEAQQMLLQRHTRDADWKGLMSLEQLQGNVISETIDQVQKAAQDTAGDKAAAQDARVGAEAARDETAALTYLTDEDTGTTYTKAWSVRNGFPVLTLTEREE